MKLNEFAKGVHQNAVEHGWWEDPRTFWRRSTSIIAPGLTAMAGKLCDFGR